MAPLQRFGPTSLCGGPPLRFRSLSRRRLAILAAIVLVVGAISFLPVEERVLEVATGLRGAGPVGALAFAVVYLTATLGLIPGSVLTLAAGFAYGPFVGLLLVSPVSSVAAAAAFSLGRTAARPWIAAKVEAWPRFAALDRAVATDGFKLVLLLRLSPIFPFALLNYALGLTRVRFRDFILASWIGMLPGTLLYTYLGSLVTSAAELASGRSATEGPWRRAAFVGGSIITLVVTVAIARMARRALARELSTSEIVSDDPTPPR